MDSLSNSPGINKVPICSQGATSLQTSQGKANDHQAVASINTSHQIKVPVV